MNAQVDFDKSFANQVIGVDEVGRGCLAGPLVAASVLIDYSNVSEDTISLLSEINDSKQVSEKKRNTLSPLIVANFPHQIITISNQEIDQFGIEAANQKALTTAITDHKSDALALVDGRGLRNDTPHTGIIKGDSKSFAIACASIIAKVYRDNLMIAYAKEYPLYAWESNKGYGSKVHRQAIIEHGLSEYHRVSFCQKILAKKG